MSQGMKDSGIQWLGDIPDSWNIKRVKYTANLKGRIGWQGLTSEEYQDDGAFLITGVDFKNGGIDWENCVHVPMKRWEEAREIQIQNGDLLIVALPSSIITAGYITELNKGNMDEETQG